MKKNLNRIIIASLLCVASATLVACGTDATKVDTPHTAVTDEVTEENTASTETELAYKDEGDYIAITGPGEALAQSTELIIPDTIDGKPVTAIAEDAFRGNIVVKEVVLPDSITVIGAHAFDDCSELAKINIPDKVTSIEEGAFFCCESLKEIILPEGLKSIGKGAFYYCIGLKELVLPDSLSDMGNYAFCACEGLNQISIGSGLKEISTMAFMNCEGLAEVEIPENIEIIRPYAFDNCASVSSITFPAYLSEVGEKAFSGCNKITSVEINAKKLGDYAFAFCSGLTNIALGNDLTSIGAGCFQTTALTELTIPASVTELECGAFRTMYSLEKLSFDEGSCFKVVDGVVYGDNMATLLYYPLNKYDESYELLPDTTTIAPYAFEGSSVQKIITNTGLLNIRERALADTLCLTELQLSDTVKTIETEAFLNSALTELNLSASVEQVSSEVDNDTLITTITVDSKNNYYTAVDGVLYTKDMKKLVLYPNGKKDKSFDIPVGTEVIGENAFWESNSAKKLSVPATVQKIEELGLANTRNIIFEGDVAELAEHAIGYGSDQPLYAPVSNYLVIGEFGSSLEKYAMDHNLGFATDTPVLSSDNISLAQGEEAILTLSNTNPEYISFWSSDDSIATVDEKGTVKAVAKGKTSIIVVNGNCYSLCHVEVTTGDEPAVPDSNYFVADVDNYSSWEDGFYQANADLFEDKKYNENLHIYTGGDYVPIVSSEEGEDYEHYIEVVGYPDLSLYKMISDDLNLELERGHLHEDTLFYSGTTANEISRFTTTGASLKEMVDAIGTVTSHPEVISTTIDLSVTAGFGDYTLEIYAPVGVVKGSYIKKFSRFPYECEFLLGSDQKYKIIGAGVREVAPTRFEPTGAEGDSFDPHFDPYIEKYLQLEIVP